jgi:hypothetical protein
MSSMKLGATKMLQKFFFFFFSTFFWREHGDGVSCMRARDVIARAMIISFEGTNRNFAGRLADCMHVCSLARWHPGKQVMLGRIEIASRFKAVSLVSVPQVQAGF